MTPRYLAALEFAKTVHNGQTRKVTQIPYVSHPISVSQRIAQVSDDEDICIAGLLHDTIEDCDPYGSVTVEILSKKFGARVATLVNQVTEQDKSLSWEERKEKAIVHIAKMDHAALLLKTADLLDNVTDLANGVEENGLAYFQAFKRGPQTTIQHHREVYTALYKQWTENPLLPEVHTTLTKLEPLITEN